MIAPIFYPGLHQPSDAHRFERTMISIRRLLTRIKPLGCPDVMVDSGAFTELDLHGHYRSTPAEHARELRRLLSEGVANISIAVAQDYMCEPFMLEKTGLTVPEHQRLTIERYDELLSHDPGVVIMPVLQGFAPREYLEHIDAYGERLKPGMWVGVGSVCKRNGAPEKVVEVLSIIHHARPDLRLHGFGVKQTSLLHPGVREILYSADSMAWSFNARKNGRDGNSWLEAKAFTDRVSNTAALAAEPWQVPLPF